MPSVEPPLKYADFVRNKTGCFESLIDPIPTGDINAQTGLPVICNPVNVKVSVIYGLNVSALDDLAKRH